MAVVFSPLISLIQDQVDSMNAIGIRYCALVPCCALLKGCLTLCVCMCPNRAVCLSGGGPGGGGEDSQQQALYREIWEYSRGGGSSSSSSGGYGGYGGGAEDEGRIKMLYITPEKFSKSEHLVKMLGQLAAGGRLSRFVIDEAHCLSQASDPYTHHALDRPYRACFIPTCH